MHALHKTHDTTRPEPDEPRQDAADWSLDEDDLSILRDRMDWRPRPSSDNEEEAWLSTNARRRRRAQRVRASRRR
jgi:hypothetical protein